MNGIINLACNIVIPIYLLNNMTTKWGYLPALILAILFPLGFAIYEWVFHHKKSMISVLGLLNVIISGGFGLFQLGGSWFAIKEAAFPLLIGIFVTLSPYYSKPFIETLLLNPEIMKVQEIEKIIEEKNAKSQFQKLLIKSNYFFSFSFFFSAICNYILALKIFTPIDDILDPTKKGAVLNEQIATMHSKGILFIALPSFALTIFLLFYFLNQMEKLTGLKKEELMKS